MGVLRKCNPDMLKENEGLLTIDWAKSLLYRIGFVKHRGNTRAIY